MLTNATAGLLLVSAQHMGKVACVLASLAGSGAAWAQCGPAWDAPPSRHLSSIRALATWDFDGTGPAQPTVVGMSLEPNSDASALRLVARDGSRMIPFGPALSNAANSDERNCEALLDWQGNLYAAAFGSLFSIASPSQPSWTTFATTSNAIYTPHIRDLAVYNGDLIAAGRFGTIGGQNIVNVARWDGSTWSRLGINGFTAAQYVWANCLQEFQGDLYVGFEMQHGSSVQVDGLTTTGLTRWNGSAWSAPFGGSSAPLRTVRALTVWNQQLVAAGTLAFGSPGVASLQGWNGSLWQDLQLPPGIGIPSSLASRGPDLFAAGSSLARRDHAAWTLEGGTRGYGVLHAQGETMHHAGPVIAGLSFGSIARSDTVAIREAAPAWTELASGEEFIVVRQIASNATHNYVSGILARQGGGIDGLFRRAIGSNQSWELVAGTPSSSASTFDRVNAMFVDDQGVIVLAGDFSRVAGEEAFRLARVANGVVSSITPELIGTISGGVLLDGTFYFSTYSGVYTSNGVNTYARMPGTEGFYLMDLDRSAAGQSPTVARILTAAGLYRPLAGGGTWQQYQSGFTYSPYQVEFGADGLFAFWANSSGQVSIERRTSLDSVTAIAGGSFGVGKLSTTGAARKLLLSGSFTSLAGRAVNGLATWTPAEGWLQFASPLAGPKNLLAWDGVDQWVGVDGPSSNSRLSSAPGRFGVLYRWTPNTQAPAITTPPASQQLCPGRTLRLRAEYVATPSPDVRWRRNGVPIVDGPQASGAFVLGSATDRLSVYGFAASDAGSYDCVLTNPCDTMTSAAAIVTLGECSCDSIDFNNDTSIFDPMDVDAFLSVFSEGPCIPAGATCNDVDFNNDGSLFDPQDIDAFFSVFSEGPCL